MFREQNERTGQAPKGNSFTFGKKEGEEGKEEPDDGNDNDNDREHQQVESPPKGPKRKKSGSSIDTNELTDMDKEEGPDNNRQTYSEQQSYGTEMRQNERIITD